MEQTAWMIIQTGAVGGLVLVTYGFLSGKIVARWVHDERIKGERERANEWKDRALKAEEGLEESVAVSRKAMLLLSQHVVHQEE